MTRATTRPPSEPESVPDEAAPSPQADRPLRAETRRVSMYLLVGLWNTAFGYATYAVFTYLLTGMVPYAYMVAGVLGWFVSVTNAYLGYKLLVFRTTGNVISELLRCYGVYGVTLVVNLILLPVIVAGLETVMPGDVRVPYVAGAILTAGTVCYSYVMHRYYSFRQPGDQRSEHGET